MRPVRFVPILLLIILDANVFAQWFASFSNCNNVQKSCSWYCDQNLPLVNRTASGAFDTEFLSSIVYQPFERKYNKRLSIFTIPDIQPHCMELSLHCSSALPPSSQTKGSKKRMLQLNMRCDHFSVSYVAKFSKQGNCYEIFLDQMEQHSLMNIPACLVPYSHQFQLEGDGYNYLLLSQCLNVVRDQKIGNVAFWLFVNKRNTPEQNRKIVQQLPLPVTAIDQLFVNGGNASKKEPCQCHEVESTFRSIKRCQMPFGASIYNNAHKQNPTSLNTEESELPQTTSYVQLTVEVLLIILLLLVVSCSLGVVVCVVYLHFRTHLEELL